MFVETVDENFVNLDRAISINVESVLGGTVSVVAYFPIQETDTDDGALHEISLAHDVDNDVAADIMDNIKEGLKKKMKYIELVEG